MLNHPAIAGQKLMLNHPDLARLIALGNGSWNMEFSFWQSATGGTVCSHLALGKGPTMDDLQTMIMFDSNPV